MASGILNNLHWDVTSNNIGVWVAAEDDNDYYSVPLAKDYWAVLDAKIIQPESTEITIIGLPSDPNNRYVYGYNDNILKLRYNKPITEGLLLRSLYKHFKTLHREILDKNRNARYNLKDDYYNGFSRFDGLTRNRDGSWRVHFH